MKFYSLEILALAFESQQCTGAGSSVPSGLSTWAGTFALVKRQPKATAEVDSPLGGLYKLPPQEA